MARQFFYIKTAEGVFVVTSDGSFVAVEGGIVQLLNFFNDLRAIIIKENWVPSMMPAGFDTTVGKRLHRQFYLGGRLVSSTAIAQAADNVWEISMTAAWQPSSSSRSDADFLLFEFLDSIATLNNQIQATQCKTWDEPVNISSASPEWDEELKAWIVIILIETQERRSWAPIS